ncbi:hypothetical protein PIB30_100629, partial [Stylosanthes scabra]|nr:hypothetical protein [Stylosanthes scabra]
MSENEGLQSGSHMDDAVERIPEGGYQSDDVEETTCEVSKQLHVNGVNSIQEANSIEVAEAKEVWDKGGPFFIAMMKMGNGVEWECVGSVDERSARGVAT